MSILRGQEIYEKEPDHNDHQDPSDIGTSTESWEDAAKNAVEQAAEHLRELRVAEIVEKDMVIRDGKVEAYRTKIKVSFKYEGHH